MTEPSKLAQVVRQVQLVLSDSLVRLDKLLDEFQKLKKDF